jgi:hypothetical protein
LDLNQLNDHLMSRSYISGNVAPSSLDARLLNKLVKNSDLSGHPHVSRWIRHIQSFSQAERESFAQETIGGGGDIKDDIDKRVRI